MVPRGSESRVWPHAMPSQRLRTRGAGTRGGAGVITHRCTRPAGWMPPDGRPCLAERAHPRAASDDLRRHPERCTDHGATARRGAGINRGGDPEISQLDDPLGSEQQIPSLRRTRAHGLRHSTRPALGARNGWTRIGRALDAHWTHTGRALDARRCRCTRTKLSGRSWVCLSAHAR